MTPFAFYLRAILRAFVIAPFVLASTIACADRSYGQGISNKRTAIDFDAPVTFRFSRLMEKGGKTSPIAGLRNVWIRFEAPNTAGQPDVIRAEAVEGEPDEGRDTPAQSRIQFLDGTVDDFIVAPGKDGSKAKFESLPGRLHALLRDEVDEIDKICDLTEQQRSKLTLAGRGDIYRFLDRVEKLKSKFKETGELQTEDQFRRWVAPLGAEAERLGKLLDAGIFDSESLFSKMLSAALSRDQSDRFNAQPRGIVVPEFPDRGWIGGPAPDLKGKPYLIHFWAMQSAPCKSNLPALKKLAEEGASIIAIHPVPARADEVENFVREEKLPYPTLAGSHDVVNRFMNISGCRVKVLPYCIVVDRAGLVAGFGILSPKLLVRFEELRSERPARGIE